MVIVSQRRGCHGRLSSSMRRECVGRKAEMSTPIVEKEQRLTGRENEDEILGSIVVNIRKQRHGRGVKDIHPSLFADVLKAAITQISEKAIRQPSGLTHIEVLQAVTVIISRGDALMAVDVHARGRVHPAAPNLVPVAQLLSEGGIASQSRL